MTVSNPSSNPEDLLMRARSGSDGGAIELVGRVSYIDLDDADIRHWNLSQFNDFCLQFQAMSRYVRQQFSVAEQF